MKPSVLPEVWLLCFCMARMKTTFEGEVTCLSVSSYVAFILESISAKFGTVFGRHKPYTSVRNELQILCTFLVIRYIMFIMNVLGGGFTKQKSVQYINTHVVRYVFLIEVFFKVILRPTVSRPVRLGVRSPSGTSDQFFFLLEIFFRQLRVCYFCSALSDERTGL
jgi:hypothetical protein